MSGRALETLITHFEEIRINTNQLAASWVDRLNQLHEKVPLLW